MKRYPILFLIAVIFMGCEGMDEVLVEKQAGIYISLMPQSNLVRATVDADNLQEECNIEDLSVFLTEVGGNAIVNKFVHQSFTPAGGTSTLVALQLGLDPTAVNRKDVYVIVNCSDIASLNAVQTLDDLKHLQTRVATTAAGLSATAGLPMYGQSLNTNLGTTSINAPALVMLTRTCAKLRITLTFTSGSAVGTNNEYRIVNAAPYTRFVKNPAFSLTASDLISYPRMAFNQIDAQNYQGIAYVYESSQIPTMHIYTTIEGQATEYIIDSNFPLPVRNNLYDIQVQIFPPSSTTRASNALNYTVIVHSN